MNPIFSKNKTVDKNAFLDWRISPYGEIENLHAIAEGYLSSSIELAKTCLVNNLDKKADMLVFPILNNANHGIELYLKAILWTLNKIIKSKTKVEGKHNIKQIYETIRGRIENYPGQIKVSGFNKRTKILNLYIVELFAKIESTPQNDKMDFSRYPFSKDYINHFYINSVGAVTAKIGEIDHPAPI